MFCNNCGTEVKDDKKFCHKCGNEINVDKNDNKEIQQPEVKEHLPKTVKEIDTMAELTNYMRSIKNMQNISSVLAHTINAQLYILESIKSATLTSSVFDLMLESLNRAIKIEKDQQKIRDLQGKAAIMTNATVFFMDGMQKWLMREKNILQPPSSYYQEVLRCS